MSKSYVVDGAKLKCTMGSSQSSLKVVPTHRVNLRGSAKANIGDGKPFVNVPPFGMCKSPANPAVAAVIASSAGATTQAPCTPVCAMWLGGKADVLIEKMPALLSDSKLICGFAGTITIEDDGQ
jgi:hypothetical protein